MRAFMTRITARLVSGTVLLLCTAGVAAAEAGGTLPVEPEKLQDIIAAGGWAMKVIVALSVLAIFLVVFFLLAFRASRLYPKAFLRDAEDAAEDGDIDALQAICRQNDSAASRIIGSAVEQIIAGGGDDYMVVRDAIEDEGARQAGILWQRIQYLMDVAVVAPMVGLLGTVIGMYESFAGIRSELAAVKADALAPGVAKALITTAGGLIVGIAAMILYALFRGRVNSLVSGLESGCNRVLRRLVARRK